MIAERLETPSFRKTRADAALGEREPVVADPLVVPSARLVAVVTYEGPEGAGEVVAAAPGEDDDVEVPRQAEVRARGVEEQAAGSAPDEGVAVLEPGECVTEGPEARYEWHALLLTCSMASARRGSSPAARRIAR